MNKKKFDSFYSKKKSRIKKIKDAEELKMRKKLGLVNKDEVKVRLSMYKQDKI